MRLEAVLFPQVLEQNEVQHAADAKRFPILVHLARGQFVARLKVGGVLEVANDHRDGVDDPLRVEDDELTHLWHLRQIVPADRPKRVEVGQHQLHLALERDTVVRQSKARRDRGHLCEAQVLPRRRRRHLER